MLDRGFPLKELQFFLKRPFSLGRDITEMGKYTRKYGMTVCKANPLVF
jgi:hypothetical protein